MRMVLAVAACFCAATCGPKALPPDSAATANSMARTGEGPPHYYDAASKTAEAFTGGLEIRDVSGGPGPAIKIVADNGHVYEAKLMTAQRGGDRIGATPVMWATLMPIPEDADVGAYAVTSELVNARAPNGGLCNPAATKFIAVASFKEDDPPDKLILAAFSDESWPPRRTPKLCGTFSYTARPLSKVR